MKRTLLLMLAALGAAVLAYLAASVLLPDPSVVRRDDDAGSDFDLPRATAPGEGVGPSEGVQFRVFDPDTNRPVAQIVIGRYRRAGERTVSLTDVRVTVTVDGGAAAVIQSPGGTVEVEPPASGRESGIDAESLTNAQSARLEDVRVQWYADANDLNGNHPATATLLVDNLVFDYARFVLRTGDTTVNEQTVLADDVRVTVESDDYRFVGYGLTVEWDPEAKRPELLQVARGESITFLTPSTLLQGSSTATAPNVGPALASRTLTAALFQEEEPAAAEDVVPYAVTLLDDLKATQGERTLLTGDRATLYVPLAFEDQQADEPAAAKPRRKAKRTERRPRQPKPEEESEPPLIVTWTGPLTLVPAPPEVDLADREDSKVELVGSPLIANTEDGTITAGRLWFEQSADRLEVDGFGGQPVRFADADGNVLESPRLIAAPDAGTATALGAGRAVLPGESESTQLVWAAQCDFRFEQVGAGDAEQRVLRQIDAVGDVEVAANKLALTSQALSITLGDPPPDSDEPTPVEAVRATGDVYCLVNAGGADEATFAADTLWLAFPDGVDGPIEATAEGNVSTVQADGTMRGDRLTARIVNGDTGRPQLQSLRVDGRVIATDVDGQTVRGAVATLDGEGQPLVVVGGDGASAIVEAALDGSTLRIDAPAVVLDPADQSLATRDGGTLLARLVDEDGVVREQRLAWSGTFTATDQRVDVAGDVVASGPLEDGATFDLAAQSVGVALSMEDDTSTTPTIPTTQPAGTALLADIDRVDLAGDVQLAVAQPGDAAGDRTFDLRAETLSAWPATEAVEIPGPGRALYRDDRPEPDEDAEAGAKFRGNAAIGWSESLVFDPDANRLRISGEATVAVEPAGDRPFRLTGDRMDVLFATVGEERQIERALVEGTVRVVPASGGQTILADHAIYDPATQTLVAVGTEGRSVRVLDANGAPLGQFGRVIYNVETGQIDEMTDLRAGG